MTLRRAVFSLFNEPDVRRFGLVTEDEQLVEVPDFEASVPVSDTRYTLDSVFLHPPIPVTPSKMIAVGMNYPAHIDEMKHVNVPADPVLFMKSPSSLIGHGQSIQAAEAWGRVDYEGEIAVVIGARCKNVPESDALGVILGYTLANDVTARTLQRQDNQWGRAKNFDTFCPLGPFLRLSEGVDPQVFKITTTVDGTQVQEGWVSQIRFSIPFLIAYISSIMTLERGDVILTGTPHGVSALRHGQVVAVIVPEIGTLRNRFEVIPDASSLHRVREEASHGVS